MPAPATPAAPAPAPAPAPTPAPAPNTTPAPAPADDNPFANVDALFEPEKPSAPEPKPDAKGGKPPEKPKAPEKPATPTKGEPKALREELDRVKSDLAAREKAHTDLEAKIKDYEAKGKDTTALTNRLNDMEKMLKERDAQIRALRHEMSPEFVDKYDKPYQKYANNAKIEIEALQIGEWKTDETTGQKQWIPTRNADWQKDFASIYSLPYAQARQRAKEQFGEDSDLVMQHYQNLHRMNRDREEALVEEKANAQKREEEDKQKESTVREGFEAACTRSQKDLEDKFPDFYQPEPGDKEMETAYQEGWKILNLKPQTFQQAVALATRNRLNAATAPMLQLKVRRLSARIAELEGKLEKRGKNEPGTTKTPTAGAGASPEDDVETWKKEAREAISG